MTNPPSGQLVQNADGNELVVSRTFRAPIEDVWASVTEPDRTARWFGTWKGDAAPGRMIKVQMGFEDQAPWLDKRIDVCDPPRRLALSNESGNMRIELLLSHGEGETELRLVHHLDPTGRDRRVRSRLGVLPGHARGGAGRSANTKSRRLLSGDETPLRRAAYQERPGVTLVATGAPRRPAMP